jgi:GntR family transcriptional repressor for pyruvate dehydrogenase complex
VTVVQLQRGRLADQVAAHLTNEIASGVLAPGILLPNEQMLAARFAVGKSAIRESVKIVATRGLVTVQQGYGTVVNPRSRWNLHDHDVMFAMQHHLSLEQLLEVRRLIEPEIAALAAKRANDDDLAVLARLLKRRAILRGPEEIALWSLAFHEAIAEASHNVIYGFLISSVSALMITKLRNMGERPDDPASEPPDVAVEVNHARIYEAISGHDSELARRYSLRHLDELRPYWERLTAEPRAVERRVRSRSSQRSASSSAARTGSKRLPRSR